MGFFLGMLSSGSKAYFFYEKQHELTIFPREKLYFWLAVLWENCNLYVEIIFLNYFDYLWECCLWWFRSIIFMEKLAEKCTFLLTRHVNGIYRNFYFKKRTVFDESLAWKLFMVVWRCNFYKNIISDREWKVFPIYSVVCRKLFEYF